LRTRRRWVEIEAITRVDAEPWKVVVGDTVTVLDDLTDCLTVIVETSFQPIGDLSSIRWSEPLWRYWWKNLCCDVSVLQIESSNLLVHSYR
jgi:hypothetical protein